MNKKLVGVARDYLNTNLVRLPENCQNVFKLMYGRKDGKRSMEDAKDMPIAVIVAEIPPAKLSWAMDQVEATLKNHNLVD